MKSRKASKNLSKQTNKSFSDKSTLLPMFFSAVCLPCAAHSTDTQTRKQKIRKPITNFQAIVDFSYQFDCGQQTLTSPLRWCRGSFSDKLAHLTIIWRIGGRQCYLVFLLTGASRLLGYLYQYTVNHISILNMCHFFFRKWHYWMLYPISQNT